MCGAEGLAVVGLQQSVVAATLEVLGGGEACGDVGRGREQALRQQGEGVAVGHPVDVQRRLGEREAALELGRGGDGADPQPGAVEGVEQAVVLGHGVAHLRAATMGSAKSCARRRRTWGAAAVAGEAAVEQVDVEAFAEGAIERAQAAVEFGGLATREESGR